MKTNRFQTISITTILFATAILLYLLFSPSVGSLALAEAGSSSSSLDFSDDVWAIDVEGDYIYLGVGNHLTIADISDPLSPVQLGEIVLNTTPICSIIDHTFGRVFDVAVSGDYAYVAADAGWTKVVDVSDPLHPYEIGVLTGGFRAMGVAVDGPLLAVATTDCRLPDPDSPHDPIRVVGGSTEIYDLTVPGSPAEIAFALGGYEPLSQNNVVAISEDYIYSASSYKKALSVVFIDRLVEVHVNYFRSWPESPEGLTPIGLITYGDYLYMTAGAENGDEMIVIFDISDPFHPDWVTSFPKPRADSMAVANGKLYIAHDQTIEAYDLVDPESPSLLFSHVFAETVQDIDAQGSCVYAGVASDFHIFCASDPVVTVTPSPTPQPALYFPLIHKPVARGAPTAKL